MYRNTLEQIVKQVRDTETRLPNEDLDTFFRRTWQLALRRHQEEKEPLPRVQAIQERSRRLLHGYTDADLEGYEEDE